jgi:transcription initiation factor TFIIB
MDYDRFFSAFDRPAQPALVQELYRPNLNITLSCPECRTASNLVEDFASGDMICGDCGLVLGDRIIDTRSEWRTFADGDKGGADPVRVGAIANPFLASSQLDTDIGFRDGFSGRARELARVQGKSTSKADLRLLSVYKDIDALAEPVSLPKTVTDIAKEIYKKADDAKLLKNKVSGRTVVAACLFLGCRQANVPRTFSEMAALTRVPKKDLAKVYKMIETHLRKDSATKRSDPTTRTLETAYLPTGQTSAADLMSRFCNRLHLSVVIDAMCSTFAKRVDESGFILSHILWERGRRLRRLRMRRG